jgi:hypothetical protein
LKTQARARAIRRSFFLVSDVCIPWRANEAEQSVRAPVVLATLGHHRNRPIALRGPVKIFRNCEGLHSQSLVRRGIVPAPVPASPPPATGAEQNVSRVQQHADHSADDRDCDSVVLCGLHIEHAADYPALTDVDLQQMCADKHALDAAEVRAFRTSSRICRCGLDATKA